MKVIGASALALLKLLEYTMVVAHSCAPIVFGNVEIVEIVGIHEGF